MSGEISTALTSFKEPVEKASFITALWLYLDNNRDGAVEAWKEVEAYRYATDTHALPNNSSAFTHSTHIPVIAAIAEDLEAIITQVVMPHEDWFTFKAMSADAAKKATARAVVSYLKNRFALNEQEGVVKKLVTSLVNYGVCFSQVAHVDERNEDKVGYVGPKTRLISPYDIVFNPTAPDFNSTSKIIREIISVGELVRRGKKGILDNDAVQAIIKQRSVYLAAPKRSVDKSNTYTPLGYGTYEEYISQGHVELLWFYGDVYDQVNDTLHESRVIVVVDDTHVVLDEEVKTPTGRPYISRSVWKEVPDNLWGQGPLANIVGLNYQVNHRENAKSEGLDRLIYPDKVFVGDIEEIYNEETGQTTYINAEGGGGVQELAINTQFLGFNLEIQGLEQHARSAARLPSDLTGEKTALEFSALTDGGMRGFIDKARDLERTSLEKHLQASLELAHEHFGDAFAVPSQNEGGFIEMLNITKDSLAVDGILVPKGARRFARKNQIMSSITQLSATGLMQVVAPHMSGKGTANLIEELLEVGDTGMFEEFAGILEQGEAQQVMNQVEQSTALEASQPSLEETMLQQEIEGLE